MEISKKFLFLSSIVLLLAGCSFSSSKSSSTIASSSSEDSSSEVITSESSIESSIIESSEDSSTSSKEEESSESIETSSSEDSSISEISSIEESSSTSTISDSITSEDSSTEETSKETYDPVTYKFYCVNDFHGAVNYNNKGNYVEYGIANYFGGLKQLKEKDPEHTILLSAGDMWEGSYESNYNYGRLVTDCMNQAGFDAMALGNHEFDWGQQIIEQNALIAEFPMLCCNIREIKNGYLSENHPWKYADLVSGSVILEKGGHKIGIVGAIGSSEITSICSNKVNDIGFLDEETLACAESVKLKNAGAEIVVLALHNDANTVIGSSNYWSCYRNLKKYFDGVFTAHTHTYNNYLTDDGVPLVQSYCNGEAYSYFEITINGEDVLAKNNDVLEASKLENEYTVPFYHTMETYFEDDGVDEKLSSVAGTLEGSSLTTLTVANLGNVAIYEAYKEEYPDLIGSMMNAQRDSLDTGEVTYSDLFKSMPFFNNIVIVKLSGSNIKKEARYSNISGYFPNVESLKSSTYYTVAVIDYLLYHQGTNRIYNYFSDMADGSATILGEYSTYPADLTFDYVKKKGVIYSSDYSVNNPDFKI